MKSTNPIRYNKLIASFRVLGIAVVAVLWMLQCGVVLGQTDTTWQRIVHEKNFDRRKSIILKDGVWILFSNPDRLPDLAKLSEELANQHQDDELRAAAHIFRAMYLRNNGSLDSALFLFSTALDLLRHEGPTLQLARNYNLISLVVRELGDDETFLAYNDSAITIADAINDRQFRLLLKNNRASILLKLKKEEAALSVMREINHALKQSSDYGFRSSTSLNLAYLFRGKDQIDSAFYYTQQAIDQAERAGENRQLASALSNLGQLELQQNEPIKAQAAISRSLGLYRNLHDTRGILNASIQLARVQFKTGDIERATLSLDSVIDAARAARIMETLIMALNEVFSMHEQNSNYEEALRHHKELRVIQDSLNTVETQEHIANLEAQFQFREQQRKLEILERDRAIEKQKTYILYGLIVGLILLSAMTLVVLIIKFQSRQKIALKEKARLKLELEKRELKEEKLNSELTLKNKQLTTKALLLSERNELLTNLMKKLNGYSGLTESNRTGMIAELKTELKLNLHDGADWKEFRTYFEETNPEFLEKVDQLNVDLSEKDRRLLALSRLGLNTKEIASLMHIEPDSVKMSRYRLKKKLNLSEEESIWDFVNRQ